MRYPSARAVRAAKGTCVMLPLLTILFSLLFITIKFADHAPRTRYKRQRKITLEEATEGSGICDKLNLTQLPNGTVILPKVDPPDVNRTVLEICKWVKETTVAYYRPHKEKVATYKHNFLISGDTLCDTNTDIVIIVHSLHDYHEKRMAIRTTWGNAVQKGEWVQGITIDANIKLGFIFGLHSKNKTWDTIIKDENEKYHDIIQGDFYEHYHNMTLKSLLGLKWTMKYCPSAKLLVKSDDDMILNWPYLLEELAKQDMTNAIMGPYNEGSRAYRTGKWKIPKEEFPLHFYPPYESGSAYIINADLVPKLFNLSEYIPHIFIDDVYITGILGKILNVRHIKHSGFAFWTDRRPGACYLLRNWILTGTKMNPHVKLLELWAEMEKTKVDSCPETMPEK